VALIDAARVARMARDLITQHGLPLQLVDVTHEPPRWRVTIRHAAEREIFISDSLTPRELRTTLRDRLDAASS
jgi:hypothetical protein